MSKITRMELVKLNPYTSVNANDRLFERIEQREEEFAELAEAAVVLLPYILDNRSATGEPELNFPELNFIHAARKFIKTPSPADRLDALADGGSVSVEVDTVRVHKSDLRAIAAEIREGEK